MRKARFGCDHLGHCRWTHGHWPVRPAEWCYKTAPSHCYRGPHDHAEPTHHQAPLGRAVPRRAGDRARAARVRRPALPAGAGEGARPSSTISRAAPAPSSSCASTCACTARATAASRTPCSISRSRPASTRRRAPAIGRAADALPRGRQPRPLRLGARCGRARAAGKILCRPDCAGLCPVCGKDLNAEPHEHDEPKATRAGRRSPSSRTGLSPPPWPLASRFGAGATGRVEQRFTRFGHRAASDNRCPPHPGGRRWTNRHALVTQLSVPSGQDPGTVPGSGEPRGSRERTAILARQWPSRREKPPSRAATSAARNHGIEAPRVNICPQCGRPKRPHRMCPTCKTYRGREIEPLRTSRALSP